MLTTIAFIGSVLFAIICLVALGPYLGAIVWVTVYAIIVLVGRRVKRAMDPARIWELEHASPSPRTTGRRSSWLRLPRSRRP